MIIIIKKNSSSFDMQQYENKFKKNASIPMI